VGSGSNQRAPKRNPKESGSSSSGGRDFQWKKPRGNRPRSFTPNLQPSMGRVLQAAPPADRPPQARGLEMETAKGTKPRKEMGVQSEDKAKTVDRRKKRTAEDTTNNQGKGPRRQERKSHEEPRGRDRARKHTHQHSTTWKTHALQFTQMERVLGKTYLQIVHVCCCCPPLLHLALAIDSA